MVSETDGPIEFEVSIGKYSIQIQLQLKMNNSSQTRLRAIIVSKQASNLSQVCFS